MGDKIIVLTTFPDLAGAESLAHELVSRKLAACVNILPSMTSIYRWQDKIETGREHQLVIKTQAHRLERIEQWIDKCHPYELPELLVLPVQDGAKDYLTWITEATHD